jgi:hypothetical protein
VSCLKLSATVGVVGLNVGFLMYSYLTSSLSLAMDIFCCVNFESGEVLGILILAKFGITFSRRHFWLK